MPPGGSVHQRTLEERLLWINFALNQFGDVFVVDDECHLWLVCAVICYLAFSSLGINHPVAFGAAGSVRDLEPVNAAHLFNKVLGIFSHRLLENLHKWRHQESIGSGLDLAVATDDLRGSRLASFWEAELVEAKDNCTTKADVVLQGKLGTGDLTLVSLSTQLPAQLVTLRQSSGTEWMSLGDQTTAGVDNVFSTLNKVNDSDVSAFSSLSYHCANKSPPTIGVITPINQLVSFAFGAQSECFVSDQLVSREAIVELDDVNVLGLVIGL